MKRKNALAVADHTVDIEGTKYYRRDYDNGTTRHYRIDRRRACLVQLTLDTNCKLIARIDAALAA